MKNLVVFAGLVFTSFLFLPAAHADYDQLFAKLSQNTLSGLSLVRKDNCTMHAVLGESSVSVTVYTKDEEYDEVVSASFPRTQEWKDKFDTAIHSSLLESDAEASVEVPRGSAASLTFTFRNGELESIQAIDLLLLYNSDCVLNQQ